MHLIGRHKKEQEVDALQVLGSRQGKENHSMCVWWVKNVSLTSLFQSILILGQNILEFRVEFFPFWIVL